MAGGLDALVRSAEGAEDNEAAGAQAMADAKIGADDVVIGVAASGTTPFTIGALAGGERRGRGDDRRRQQSRTRRCLRWRAIASWSTPAAK